MSSDRNFIGSEMTTSLTLSPTELRAARRAAWCRAGHCRASAADGLTVDASSLRHFTGMDVLDVRADKNVG